MAQTQQTFVNAQKGLVYVSVEPWPECFELNPGDKLTLIWDAVGSGDATQVSIINERELVIWPSGEVDGMQFLLNGEPARDRSWAFKPA